MSMENLVQVTSYGLETAMFVSAPVLLLGLVAGVGVSIVQAATQINDAALAFIPKIAAVAVGLAVFGPWMLSRLVSFATFTFNQIPTVTM